MRRLTTQAGAVAAHEQDASARHDLLQGEGNEEGRASVIPQANSRWPLGVARLAVLVISWLALGLFCLALPERASELASACVSQVCAPGQVPAGTAVGQWYPVALLASECVCALLYALLASLIFWRRSGDPMALFVAGTLALWGVTFTPTMTALARESVRWFWPVALISYAGAAALTLFFYLFPDGRLRPRWTWSLAVVWILSQAPTYFAPQSGLNPRTWPPALYAGVSACFLAVMVALQLYRYRWRSTPRQQRQVKWVVFGVACALTGYAALLITAAQFPALSAPGTTGYVLLTVGEDASVALIPLCIGIAILRERLYDIDVLINRALVYGLLTALLAFSYFGVVVVLQQTFSILSRQPQRANPLITVISTLAIAALFQPARRRIQGVIDRRFFRTRYDAARMVDEFGRVIRSEVDLPRLNERLIDVVHRALEPTHASLWLRSQDGVGSHGVAWAGERQTGAQPRRLESPVANATDGDLAFHHTSRDTRRP